MILAALLDHLQVGPVDMVGWSDGGIEALLMGVRYPDKVKKLVAMAANLNPGPDAIDAEVVEVVKNSFLSLPDDVQRTPEGKRQLKVGGIMLTEPHSIRSF
jgi:pimeloyl-ACP methyl ester carboxylesterase